MLLEFIKRVFYIIPKYPETVQIAITNRCNFNCPMCQRHALKVEIKDMDLADYKNILEKLKGVKNLILTGWGEPFMHPQLISMIKLGKEKGYKVRLTTNGSLLTPIMIEDILSSRLDAITFSVDSVTPGANDLGHAVINQLNMIKQLAERKRATDSNLKIYLQTVFNKTNTEELIAIAQFAKDNQLDRLRLTRLDTRFHQFERPSSSEELMIIKKLESELKNSKVGIDFLPHAAFDGVVRKIYKKLYPFLHARGKYCLRTFSDVYINENSLVTPCCSLPLVIIGDLKKESLISIWQNKEFKNFRKNQKKICGRCDILSLRPYDFKN